jgi:hypothetical protein
MHPATLLETRDPRGTLGARALVLALLLVVALAGAACRGKGESARGAPGGAAAAAIADGLAAAAGVRAPWRCAALDGAAATDAAIEAGGARWTIAGRTATRAPAGAPKPVRIAFAADAEDASPETLAALAKLRAKLDKLDVDAIVTLGGMGATPDELAATLGALSGHALVVAIPGDREPAAGHRATVAALAGSGIVDGSLVRWLVIDGVGVATLPGQPYAGRLAHGVEGCGQTDADATALLAVAPADLRVRIVASQRAPRHADGTDGAALGASAGDAGLAAALAAPPTAGARADLVVHGSLDGSPSPAGRAEGPALVATGVTSGSPRLDAAGRRLHPAIVVVTVEGSRVSWQPIAP